MRWGGGRGSRELYKGRQSGVDGRVTSLMWMWRRQRTRGGWVSRPDVGFVPRHAWLGLELLKRERKSTRFEKIIAFIDV